MAAIINTIIPDDNFEIIRDKIAVILLEELQNQSLLQSNPLLDISKVWIERRTPFNMSELPAINVSIGEYDNTNKTLRQREKSVKYYIDSYVSQKHYESNDADELSGKGAWKVVRNCEYILQHPVYKTLGLQPGPIKHTEVQRVQAGEADTGDSAKCMVLRLEFVVEQFSTETPLTIEEVTGLDTTVKLYETEKGFYYQLDL